MALFHAVSPARSVDDLDFSDLTDATRTGPAVWVDDGVLEIPFDRDLTADEVANITIRVMTADADEESARHVVQAAIVANEAYRLLDDADIGLPRLKAQVRALTEQLDAGFRLTIGRTQHDD